MRELIVATKNAKKLEEIRHLLAGMRVRVSSLADFSRTPEIREDGDTFGKNAAKKALTIARFSGKLTMGEDSGLCVDALKGAPGVYSARFAGRGKDDLKNNAKILRLLKEIKNPRKRSCRYVCAAAIADKSGLIGVVEGECRGQIGFEPKGTFGFGYDPIFVIPAYKKTFAQLGPTVKHRMSHRFKALVKAKRLLERYFTRA